MKWCAVSLVTGENHFLAAMQSANQRIGGVVTEENVNTTPSFLTAIGANLTVLFEGTSRTEYRLVVSRLLPIVLLIFFVYRIYQVKQKPRPGTAFLLLLGAIVFLRYGFLANHSYLHSFFTYRALISTIFAILAAMVINLQPAKQERVQMKWN